MQRTLKRQIRLWDLALGRKTRRPGLRVWDDDVDSRHWPIHAPDIPLINLDRLLELAKQTPYFDLARIAVEMCQNGEWHDVEAAGVPKAACPISKMSTTDVATYTAHKYIAEIPEHEVRSWGKLSSIPEPTKTPPRRRPIIDLIMANALLCDAPKVTFTSISHQLATAMAASIATSFDMKGWYFAIPVSEAVSRHLAFRTAENKWYRWLRGPMGHKWFVFVGHIFTSVIAWIPGTKSDIIIDNVLYTETDETRLRATNEVFRSRCAYVGATLGQDTGLITKPDHRGIQYDLVSKSWGLRTTFVEKFRKQVTHALTKPTTAGQWLSIAGKVNWMRQILDITPLHIWKMTARAAPCNPRRPLAPTQALIAELRYLYAVASKRQTRAPHPAAMALLVTDAAKANGKASWGAVLLLPDGSYRTAAHDYDRQAAMDHITALELRALFEAVEHFNITNRSLTWWTDNTAAALVVRSGRTHSFPMWCWLRRIKAAIRTRSLQVAAKWLASELNPADGLSRGHALTEADRYLLEDLARTWAAHPWVWEEKRPPAHTAHE
jgi:hypothetical protein